MSMAPLSVGFSDAALYVENTARSGRRRLRESQTLGIEALMEDLGTVWDACRLPNWDGFAALPVEQDTLRNTYLFLETLPLGFPAPTVGAEPDGALTLEWHHSARRTLSVSIEPDGVLNYAALLGPNRAYGSETFYGEVPERIMDLIRRVFAT